MILAPPRSGSSSSTKTKTTTTTKPTKTSSNDNTLAAMEEIITKLGLGKDKALLKRFWTSRFDCVREFLKQHKIDEKALAEWSQEGCRATLKRIVNHFLWRKGGAQIWADSPSNKTGYTFSNDGEIITKLLTKYFFLYINSPRRISAKPRVRKSFLRTHGKSKLKAIEVDDLSDDGLPSVAEASSPERVPKREPCPDTAANEDTISQPQTSALDSSVSPSGRRESVTTPSLRYPSPENSTAGMSRPTKRSKRPAEAEHQEAQNRAKSARPDNREPEMPFPRDDDEDSLFSGDDEPICDQLVGRSSRRTRHTDYTREGDDLRPSSTGVNARSDTVDRAVSVSWDSSSVGRQSVSTATSPEPAIFETTAKNDLKKDKEKIQGNSSKDSVPDRRDDSRGEIVCKALPKPRVSLSPYASGYSVPEKEPENAQKAHEPPKDTKTTVVLGREIKSKPKRDSAVSVTVPEQPSLPSTGGVSVAAEQIIIDLTIDGIDESSSDLSTGTTSTIDYSALFCPPIHDTKVDIALTSLDTTKELPPITALEDSSCSENPYFQLFKPASLPNRPSAAKLPSPSETPPPSRLASPPNKPSHTKKELYFDSEHATKVLNTHLRNHAKHTTTPIKFSFAVRHSTSHAERFSFSPFSFFNMTLQEFVGALPMEDKNQITGLCIRQYGPITCLRQVYLYNEEVFGNIRDEFLRYIEGDIRKAQSTGKRLDYEISIEPIMDD